MAERLSSWLAEQEVRGFNSPPHHLNFRDRLSPASKSGYLLLPSRDMAEIPLKRRKSSIEPTNQIETFSRPYACEPTLLERCLSN